MRPVFWSKVPTLPTRRPRDAAVVESGTLASRGDIVLPDDRHLGGIWGYALLGAADRRHVLLGAAMSGLPIPPVTPVTAFDELTDALTQMAAFEAAMADLDTARTARRVQSEEADGRDTFVRARDLEQLIASGAALTKQQQVWLAGYQTTAEYRTWSSMVEDFGEDVLAK